jgi:hypothetical protein
MTISLSFVMTHTATCGIAIPVNGSAHNQGVSFV